MCEGGGRRCISMYSMLLGPLFTWWMFWGGWVSISAPDCCSLFFTIFHPFMFTPFLLPKSHFSSSLIPSLLRLCFSVSSSFSPPKTSSPAVPLRAKALAVNEWEQYYFTGQRLQSFPLFETINKAKTWGPNARRHKYARVKRRRMGMRMLQITDMKSMFQEQ